MTSKIVVHDENGRPHQFVSKFQPALRDTLRARGRLFVETDLDQVDMASVHVENGELKPRPDMGLRVSGEQIRANGADEFVIANLPAPCSVFIDDEEHMIEDRELILTPTTPGTYQIRVERWPFKACYLTLTASAP